MRDNRLRTRITFIESRQEVIDQFKTQYRHLLALATAEDSFLDIEWEFLCSNVGAPDTQEYLREAAGQAEKDCSRLTIAICDDNSNDAIRDALYLPQDIYRYALQILVYQPTASSIIDNICGRDMLAGSRSPRYAKLRAFGMPDYAAALRHDRQKQAHRASRVYAAMYDERIVCDRPIDFIRTYCDLFDQHPEEWSSMAIWQQWSSSYNINCIPSKIRAIAKSTTLCAQPDKAFSNIAARLRGEYCSLVMDDGSGTLSKHIKDVDLAQMPQTDDEREMYLLRLMSEVEHNRWNTEKLLMGYRPLDEEEKKPLYDDTLSPDEQKATFNRIRDMKNGPERVQYCICSFDELYDLDIRYKKDIVGLDVVFTIMMTYLTQKT